MFNIQNFGYVPTNGMPCLARWETVWVGSPRGLASVSLLLGLPVGRLATVRPHSSALAGESRGRQARRKPTDLNSFIANRKSVMSFPVLCQGNVIICTYVNIICGKLREQKPYFPVRLNVWTFK
jgi:hypothetical protein